MKGIHSSPNTRVSIENCDKIFLCDVGRWLCARVDMVPPYKEVRGSKKLRNKSRKKKLLTCNLSINVKDWYKDGRSGLSGTSSDLIHL